MILQADARHIPLASGVVQCCVTSPPYWGLRDYGTATWVGGDAGCSHQRPNARKPEDRRASTLGGGVATIAAQDAGVNAQAICSQCGAQRIDSQIGLEPTPEAYVQSIVSVFAEVWRVLRDDGTLWLNLGDSYASTTSGTGARGGSFASERSQWQGEPTSREIPHGLKPKDLVGIPWRCAFALQAAGWYLRSDIIWSKPNPMPESVTDRPTKAHEYLFLLSKRERYVYDAEAIREEAEYGRREWSSVSGNMAGVGLNGTRGHATVSGGDPSAGRNKRSVWTIATQPYPEAHFATFPEALIEPCILAGAPMGSLVLDPFIGSGTTGVVCERLSRRWVGLDLTYQHLSSRRTAQRGLQFATG